jgi:hypothetical protein
MQRLEEAAKLRGGGVKVNHGKREVRVTWRNGNCGIFSFLCPEDDRRGFDREIQD